MARERRVPALRADRAASDKRIEAAVADVFLGLTRRAKAQAAVATAEDAIGEALRRRLAENLTLDDAAKLCDLSGAQVRKLTWPKSATDTGKSNGASSEE